MRANFLKDAPRVPFGLFLSGAPPSLSEMMVGLPKTSAKNVATQSHSNYGHSWLSYFKNAIFNLVTFSSSCLRYKGSISSFQSDTYEY